MREDVCPTCLECLKDRKRAIETLACGHTAHRECLLGGIACGNLTCPLCRAPVVAPPRLGAAVRAYQESRGIPCDNYEFPVAEWGALYFQSDSDDTSDGDYVPAANVLSPQRGGSVVSRFLAGPFALTGVGIFSVPQWVGPNDKRPDATAMMIRVLMRVVKFEVHLCWAREGYALELLYYADTNRAQGGSIEARSALAVTWENQLRFGALRRDVQHFDGGRREFDAGGFARFAMHNAETFLDALTPEMLASWRSMAAS